MHLSMQLSIANRKSKPASQVTLRLLVSNAKGMIAQLKSAERREPHLLLQCVPFRALEGRGKY
jgi:hypothetical protein